MDALAQILKRHIWCVIIIAAIILVAIITLSFGKDENLVSHLSLTSAVVSIVLAVIVIVYMYFQDQRSSQNITEMRKLIDEGYRTMTDKADVMVSRTQALEQMMMSGITQPLTDEDTTPTPLEIKEPIQFNASYYSDGTIPVLYSLAKSYETRKTISWRAIVDLLPLDRDNTASYIYYGFGMIQGFQFFLAERGTLIWSTTQQEVKELPDGFAKSIYAEIDERLGKYKSGDVDEANWGYKHLEEFLSIIDGYFDTL